MSRPKHVAAVCDDGSGHEAIYVNGFLKDLASYPKTLDACRKLKT